jgi:hypothetical protein
MPPLYKEGLYWLILLALTAAVYGVLAIFLGPTAACGAFGLLGLAGLQPLLYRKRGKTVVWDERDTRIHYYANNVAFGTVWLVFTSLLMGVWITVYGYGGHSTISVHILPNLLMIGSIVVWTARAVAIVVQYRLQDAGKGG